MDTVAHYAPYFFGGMVGGIIGSYVMLRLLNAAVAYAIGRGLNL